MACPPPRLVRFLPFPPTCISAHPPLTQPVGNSRLPTPPSGPNASGPHSIPVLPSATSTYLAQFLSTVGGGTSSLLLVPTTFYCCARNLYLFFTVVFLSRIVSTLPLWPLGELVTLRHCLVRPPTPPPINCNSHLFSHRLLELALLPSLFFSHPMSLLLTGDLT